METAEIYKVWHCVCPHCDDDMQVEDYCYPGEEIIKCYECGKKFKVVPEY